LNAGAGVWQLGSLDLEAATLAVDRRLIPAEHGCAFGPPKSRRSRRTIALDPETVRLLVEHREAQLVERALAGDAYQDDDLVFCDELGRPIHPKTLSYRFGPTPGSRGHPRRQPAHPAAHGRHAHARERDPVHVAAARLGDDPRTVLDRYAHLLPQSDSEAAERLAGLLAG
jgi:integrase